MKNLFKVNETKRIPAYIVVIAILAVVVLAMTIGKANKKAQDEEIAKNSTTVASKTLGDGNDEPVEGSIRVYYQDEDGNDLIASVQHSGAVGTWYEFDAPEISGYRNNPINPINRCGYYEMTNDDVVFKYTALGDDYEVTWENEGVDDAEETVINVGVDNIRSTTEYGLIIVSEDENGTPINGTEFEVSEGDTVVKHGTVQDDKLYVGKVGFNADGTYTFVINQTEGVEPYAPLVGTSNLTVKVKWDSENNKFKIEETNVSHIYTSVSVNENNEIVVNVLNPKQENPPEPLPSEYYTIKVEYKINGKYIDGVTLGLQKNDEAVQELTTEDGIIIKDRNRIRNPQTFTYKVTEINVPAEYEPVLGEGVEGIATIVASPDGTNLKYSVSTNDIEGFSASVNGSVITITISSKVDKYDLSLKKFIYKIDDEYVENREPKVVMGKDGKYSYEMNNKVEEAANGQKVTYILRTYNESKEDGEGKRVIEYIPRGLKYLPDDSTNKEYQWKMYAVESDGILREVTNASEAEVIATDKIDGQKISGFDEELNEGEEADLNSLDVMAVFEIDESVFTGKEDRIIENTASIEPNENDDNGDNDTTTEKIYVKYFDLKTTKYIKSVRVKNNKKDETKEYGESTNNSVIKVDVPKSQVNSTTITITYAIKVENVGQIEGYATKINDYLPEGFEVVNTTDWKVNGNVATCTKLDSTLLLPGESTTIDIVCNWKLSEKQIGSRINEASVAEYENQYNAKDITDDNNDKEEIIAAITTGKTIYIVSVIVIGLVAIAIVVYIKNKRKEGIA